MIFFMEIFLGTEETRNSVNKEKGEKRVERIIKTPSL